MVEQNFRVLGIFSRKDTLYIVSIIIHQKQNVVFVEGAIKGKADNKTLNSLLNMKNEPFWNTVIFHEGFNDRLIKDGLEKHISHVHSFRIKQLSLSNFKRLANSKIFHTNPKMSKKLLHDIKDFEKLKDLDIILDKHGFLACLIMLCDATQIYYNTSPVTRKRVISLRSRYMKDDFVPDYKNDSDIVSSIMENMSDINY